MKPMKIFEFLIILKLFDPAPKLTPIVHYKNQSEGSTFYVFCAAEEGSIPLFFEWTKNGQNIKSVPNVNHKIEYLDMSSTLTIKKITRNDSGNYSCLVKNSFGSDSQSVVLSVKGKKFCLFVFSSD